ncbi:MAG: nuclear transport factor 2 family protein [Bryobacterales bacterium]|nr:nuclear transport factor 2 family protein [Bryobacterales bacterium]
MWKSAIVLAAMVMRAETTAELEAQVRAAETAFAQTMADRDHAAFARHLAPDAVFIGGPNVLRGATEVAEGWKRFFAPGSAAPFSWAPERVVVTATGDLAFSSGPVRNPAGARVGTYNSTWRRGAGGVWKVGLDSGCPPCDCGAAPR